MSNTHRHNHDGPDEADHGSGAHRHGPGPGSDPRWLWAALGLILLFMAAEVGTGLPAHSLALLSDAAHMLTDAASIGLVLATMKLAIRPPGGRYTYGLRRTEILSAQANGITLIVLAVWLAYEAIRRLIVPPTVTGGAVIVVALAGVAVNAVTTFFVTRASRTSHRSLNLEGAFRHLLTDVYGFIATAVAGAVIVLTGSALVSQPHVTEVHDLHVWEISSDLPAASAHVLVAPGEDCHAVRADLEALLSREYGITHTTLQVDHAPDLLTVGPPPALEAEPCSGAQCGERAEREVAEHRPGDQDHDHGRPQPAGPLHPDHWVSAPAPDHQVEPGGHGDQQQRNG